MRMCGKHLCVAVASSSFGGLVGGQTGLLPATDPAFGAGLWMSSAANEDLDEAVVGNPFGLSGDFVDDDGLLFSFTDTGLAPVTIVDFLAIFSASEAGFPSGDLLGFHVLPDARVLLCYDASSGPLADSIAIYNPRTQGIETVFDLSTFFEDPDAVSITANGDILFSTSSFGTVPASLSATGADLVIDDGDILVLEAGSGLVSRLITEADIFGPVSGNDINAIHWVDANTLLLSNDRDQDIPGIGFTLEEAVFEYDLVTLTATREFFNALDPFVSTSDTEAIFLTDVAIPLCPVDVAGGAGLDGADASALVNGVAASDAAFDLAFPLGPVDSFDLAGGLQIFGDGCP
ncbi:MAG: hypothetical protein AAGI30_09015 [Planctomycetota bacterium]